MTRPRVLHLAAAVASFAIGAGACSLLPSPSETIADQIEGEWSCAVDGERFEDFLDADSAHAAGYFTEVDATIVADDGTSGRFELDIRDGVTRGNRAGTWTLSGSDLEAQIDHVDLDDVTQQGFRFDPDRGGNDGEIGLEGVEVDAVEITYDPVFPEEKGEIDIDRDGEVVTLTWDARSPDQDRSVEWTLACTKGGSRPELEPDWGDAGDAVGSCQTERRQLETSVEAFRANTGDFDAEPDLDDILAADLLESEPIWFTVDRGEVIAAAALPDGC